MRNLENPIAPPPLAAEIQSIMKGRDSGMPDETSWNAFFDADCVVRVLECPGTGTGSIAEFGSGYGTFTVAAAKRTTGMVHAFEIESDLGARLRDKARATGLPNIRVVVRDLLSEGTGLCDCSVDHVMIFNLLHIESPLALLTEAFRILRPAGTLSVIHWKPDPTTPRGPAMEIRPTPGQCQDWSELAGFRLVRHQDLSECCDYHYGILFQRPIDADEPGFAQP